MITIEQWLYVQTLIWLLPIMFILHDFEEIIMVEKWVEKNSVMIYEKLPTKVADRIIKQFSMTTAQFSVAVLFIFLFVSGSTILAIQHLNQGSIGNIHMFIVVTLVFFLHAFTHIAQSLILRSITPGVITSIIVILPYSFFLYQCLLVNEVITWSMIFVCLPFCIFILPILLIAHWIGKKVA